jgi:hypothetical protein
VDKKESSKQSFESNEGMESLSIAKLEEKVETYFSQEGEGEICAEKYTK